MRELITNDTSSCVGCNRCIRFCPVEGANIAYSEGDDIKVKVVQDHCIVCGSCISVCHHDSRDYRDDTEKFLSDLATGTPISIFAAPAIRTNGDDWGRLLTWLRQKGVRKIYDVSLGADICTWAHIRYIQKNNPKSVITQPCPAIVNYILLYKQELLPYLSPVHSPMLCTAIYMKKYANISDKIAAISPCIAKTHEFDDTHYVHYNVTLKKLYEYVRNHNIILPAQESGFDHMDSSLGSLYPMPGGLKENVELYLGKALRIDKSEGPGVVYKALDEFSKQREEYLPAIFDVLNCPEGCNLGTGCVHDSDLFEISTIMDNERQKVLQNNDKAAFDALYEEYDRTLHLSDFIRNYTPKAAQKYDPAYEQIEEAFHSLGKDDDIARKFDCSACGANTCYDMAKQVACGFNIPKNCIQKVRDDVNKEHDAVLELSAANFSNIDEILADISKIKGLSDTITQNVTGINTAIEKYSKMAKEIDGIAMQINIISLNASIEAARAGQYGKAFSVVAEEIRRLANSSKNTVSETELVTQQATQSIKGINAMVGDISTEVEKAFDNISSISEKTKEAITKADVE